MGPFDPGGRSKGAAAVSGISFARPGEVLRARGARTPVGGGHQNGLSSAAAGLLVRFLRRLALPRSRQVRHLLLSWPSGTNLPGCSGATTAAKLMLATLLETVSSRLPSFRLWNVVDDISGHVAGTDRMVQVITAEADKAVWCRVSKRATSRSPKESPRSSSTGRTSSSRGFCGRWRRRASTRRQRRATSGQTSDPGQKAACTRRSRASVAKAAKRSRRVRQLRKAGAHTHNLTLSGSNAGVLWGSEGLGLHPHPAPFLPSRRGQSHLPAQQRAERGQNDVCPCPGSGGQEHRPCIPTSSTSGACLGDRESGKARQTSTPCRRPSEEPPQGSAGSGGLGAPPPMLRRPSCSPCCGLAGVRNRRGTSSPTTARGPTSWRLRQRRWVSGSTRQLLAVD